MLTDFSTNGKFVNFTFSGSGSYGRLKISKLRLTNPNNAYQSVAITYLSLDASALNDIFTDLPTLSGRTININGCLGSATCNRTIATSKGWTVIG